MAGTKTGSRGQLPLYHQIAADLRAQIADGTLPPGAKLPTELDLAEKWETTRTTVRQAITELEAAGLIVRERPRGNFVRKVEPMIYRPQQEVSRWPANAEMDQFMTAMAAEGRPSSQKIVAATVTPPPIVASRLHTGEPVAARLRVRSVDGEPYNLNDSYFPLDLVTGTDIMLPSDIPRGANMVLAELGYEQVYARHELETRMPTPEEADRLSLYPGTPVTEHVETGFTAEGQPVRCVINVLPGPKHKIVFECELTPLLPPGKPIVIRQARADDVETAAQIVDEIRQWLRRRGSDQWQEGLSRKRLDAAADAGTLFMVETAGGRMIGTLIVDEYADPEFWTAEDSPGAALYVHRLVIRRAAAGHDVGTAILDWASRRAASFGKRLLRLDAWRTNHELHSYYLERGWTHVRTVDVSHRGSGALFELPAGTVLGRGPEVRDLAAELHIG